MNRWICMGLVVMLAGCNRTPPEPIVAPQQGKSNDPKKAEGPPPPFTKLNHHLIERTFSTTFGPVTASPDSASTRLSTDGTYKVRAQLTLWEKGTSKPLGADVIVHQVDSGNVSLAVVAMPEKRKGVTMALGSVHGEPVALPGEGGELAVRGTKSKVAFVEGKPMPVLALAAGKVAESEGDSPEEIARRAEWAVLLTLTFERRPDSHGIELRVSNEPLADIDGLKYVGTSFREALAGGKNQATAEGVAALARAVTVDKKDPLTGGLAYTSVNVYLPYHGHSHHNIGLPDLTVQRASSDAPWELTPAARAKMAEVIGVK